MLGVRISMALSTVRLSHQNLRSWLKVTEHPEQRRQTHIYTKEKKWGKRENEALEYRTKFLRMPSGGKKQYSVGVPKTQN